ncbi:hypothetical protein VCHA53O466_140068 [Vibrio chagasii]|nr:hypothetical protein VCHA53O466_140068 [Vibrio chagasii]
MFYWLNGNPILLTLWVNMVILRLVSYYIKDYICQLLQSLTSGLFITN